MKLPRSTDTWLNVNCDLSPFWGSHTSLLPFNLSTYILKSMHKGPLPVSMWRRIVLIVIFMRVGTKERKDQRFRVLSPATITWPPNSKAATVNWSAGRKFLAFYGESLWLPRNSALTSFTLFCTVLLTVLWEILYLAISSCALNESILFFSSSLKHTTLHPSSPQIHFGFPLEL